MLSQTHTWGSPILILLGLFLKPHLAMPLSLSLFHTHAHTHRSSCFFVVTKRERKECLSQANDKQTQFQGKQEQPGFCAICCRSCSRENTICLSQYMILSSTQPHCSWELASYCGSTTRHICCMSDMSEDSFIWHLPRSVFPSTSIP